MKFVTVLMTAAVLLAAGGHIAAQGTAKPADAAQKLVNPNTATEQELAALPHLNAALAKALVSGRPFKTMVDVNGVLSKSLSKEQLTALYGKLFLPLNLNTATRQEILLIPGVGNRMANEFEEYRPYKTIEQFRKEIGKYVSKAEVARLERYVTLQ